jgi:hypothetical protein
VTHKHQVFHCRETLKESGEVPLFTSDSDLYKNSLQQLFPSRLQVDNPSRGLTMDKSDVLEHQKEVSYY